MIQLLDIYAAESNSLHLVFEYMEYDLSIIIKQYKLTMSQVKQYMIMLLKGLAFIHQNNIMHRDLKPANLLISRSGILKLADFGLARIFSPLKDSHETELEKNNEDDVMNSEKKVHIKRPYSHQVATR